MKSARDSAEVFIRDECERLYAILTLYPRSSRRRIRRAILDRLHELEMI